MKSTIIQSLLAIFIFCLIACKKENCADLDFGDQFLEPISLTYESFDEVTGVVYKDSLGNDHRYELSLDVDHLRNNLHQDSCDEEVSTITYRSEYYLRRFSSDNNTAIAYAVVVGFLDGEQILEDEKLVDILKMSVFDDNMPQEVISRICIITSNRQGDIDLENYNANQYIVHDSLTFFNKTFYNVFEQRGGVTKMYYTPAEGIVSFTNNSGAQLVLDHVE